jgi:Holliday junction resolvasome RuvABC endonuclease subunit
MRILGLDASSRTIGYSIIEYNEKTDKTKLLKCSFVKPPKDGNLFERLKRTQDMIISILEEYKPDTIAIEDIAKFMAGASTANTIITLATFNRAVGLACYNFLGKPPLLFNVLKIRHGIKINKVFPKKEDIPELVAKHLKIKFPYIYKTNKRTKIEKIAEESYDAADSCAVAYFCLLDMKKDS